MKKSANSAFTLIELLVVIAIIALLAALSMQAISTSIERARALSDAATLRSLGPILQRYLSDHDDDLPTSTGGASTTTWPQALLKVVPDNKILVSPLDRRVIVSGPSAPVSYGMNANAFGMNAGDFVSPSEFFIIAPSASVGGGGRVTYSGTAATNVSVAPGTTHGVYRSNHYLNVLFADWHVVPMNYENDFADASSPKGKKHWEPLYVEQ